MTDSHLPQSENWLGRMAQQKALGRQWPRHLLLLLLLQADGKMMAEGRVTALCIGSRYTLALLLQCLSDLDTEPTANIIQSKIEVIQT